MMGLDLALRELWPDVDYPRQLRKYFARAEGRFLTDMKAPKRALDLAGRWGRFLRETPGQFQDLQRGPGTLYQRKATNFQASSSKIAFLFERAFAECRFFTILLGLGMVVTFVHQHVWTFRWPLRTEHRLDDVFLFIPHLDLPEWGLLFFVVGWIGVHFHQLTRRFAKKDSQLPGGQE